MAKSDAERQGALTAKRKAEGWKRLWIPPTLLKAVKELLDKV